MLNINPYLKIKIKKQLIDFWNQHARLIQFFLLLLLVAGLVGLFIQLSQLASLSDIQQLKEKKSLEPFLTSQEINEIKNYSQYYPAWQNTPPSTKGEKNNPFSPPGF